MRLPGINSGMDTQLVVQEMLRGMTARKTGFQHQRTLIEWRKEAWQELNTKIHRLYTGTLSSMRLSSAFDRKTTAISNPAKANVVSSGIVSNGVQTLEIRELAKAGNLTGARISASDNGRVTSSTRLSDLGIENGSTISLGIGSSNTSLHLSANMTVGQLMAEMREAGVNANFDETHQRIFISARDTGLDNDFSLTGHNQAGIDALRSLGIQLESSAATQQKQAMLDKYNDPATLQEVIANLEELNRLSVDNLALHAQRDAANLLRDSAIYIRANNAVDEMLNELDLPPGATARLRTLLMTEEPTEAEQEELDGLKLSSGISDQDWTALGINAGAIRRLASEGMTRQAAEHALQNEEIDDYDAYITEKATEISRIDRDISSNRAVFARHGMEYGVDFDPLATIANVGATASSIIEDRIAFFTAALNDRDFSEGHRVDAQDAEIILNGASFASSSNVITVNGMTITALQKTAPGEVLSLTTNNDVTQVYNSIKNFLTEYNNLMREMNKLFNAPSSRGMNPLTDEERQTMSEADINLWEKRIKDGLLRRDDNLSAVMSAMTSAMSMHRSPSGLSLSSFGIQTQNFFSAGKDERNLYFIDGDADSPNGEGTNRLMQMLQEDPKAVEEFFTGLASQMHSSIFDRMRLVPGVSSSFTVFNDQRMDNDIRRLNETIRRWEERIDRQEDALWRKFTAMESALGRSNSTMLTMMGMFGM